MIGTETVVAFVPSAAPRPESIAIGANALDLSKPWDAAAPSKVISPYGNHDDIRRASDYCWETSLSLCGRLAETLNRIHGRRGALYWEILTLPWMSAWIENLYDRYLRLRWVRENAPHAVLDLPRMQVRGILYRTSFEVWGQSHLQAPNNRLYGLLAEKMGLAERVRSREAHVEDLAALDGDPAASRRLTALFKRYARFLVRQDLFPKCGVDWVELRDDAVRDVRFEREALERGALRLEGGPDEFQAIAGSLLPSALPRSLFEEHRSRAAYAKAMVERKKIRTLCISNTFWMNDSIKHVMSEVGASGGRLIGRQHGAGYGCYELVTPEKVERRLSEAFISWGWRDNRKCPTLPLPDPRLSRLIDAHKPTNRDILFLGSHGPSYMFRYQSYWIPEFVLSRYIPMQKAFFTALRDEAKVRIVYRPYPKDYGWDERERARHLIPGIRFDQSASSIDRIKHCALFVLDHPGTAFLEALVMNVPTIVFWDEAQCPMRPEARPYFERLKEAGVFFTSPEAAARQVGAVADDPRRWWSAESVQLARKEFCRKFAWADADWKGIWIETLNRYESRSRH